MYNNADMIGGELMELLVWSKTSTVLDWVGPGWVFENVWVFFLSQPQSINPIPLILNKTKLKARACCTTALGFMYSKLLVCYQRERSICKIKQIYKFMQFEI